MIRPVNGNLLIKPVEYKSFMASEKELFQEMGIVEAIADDISPSVKIGEKVFFDSWLASKHEENEKDWFWLVPWENVKAIDSNEPIPK